MPDSSDLKLYRERAAKWRADTDALPPGGTRDSYLAIAENYHRLADLLERRLASSRPIPIDRPDQGSTVRM